MLNELMILARIKEGDIKAFEGIFRRYYSPLCWYAAGITGDTASAEEIVEELFYVLWKNRERLQVFQSVKSYLYRSVRNEAVQFVSIRRSRSAIGHLSVRSPGRAIRPTPTRIWSTRNSRPSSGIRSTSSPGAGSRFSGCTAWRGRNMQRLPCRFRCPSRRWKRK